jgi:glycosyltransferase involved in cell wall biosynthesis
VDDAAKAALRADLDLPDGALVLLTASRLAEWKRIDRAIAAMQAVLASIPKVLLVIVGDGEERANLERQAAELGVEANVRFVGAVQQERVAEYMQCADVLLALADLSNVGNPLLEAMACGLTVVTLDAGDTRDLIYDGQTGILLVHASPRDVATAITRISDPKVRVKLGTAARDYASAHFWTWDERLRAEVDEIERIVERATISQGPDVSG